MKHWSILIISGMQNQETTWHKWLQFWPPHLNNAATLPCEMQKSQFGHLQQKIHTD